MTETATAFEMMDPAMRETTPSVFLVARPSVDVAGMRGYLADVGGASWLDRRLEESDDAPNAAQLLVEFGGRVCYRSWEPGLNPNVTRVRADQEEYLGNLLRSLHGSVLEHASYSFAFRNVSRVMTHELVRHRAGSAFSQESLRYVRLTDIGFRVPPALEPIRDQVVTLVEQLQEFQVSAAEALGIDEDGLPVRGQEGGHLGAPQAGAPRAQHRHPVDGERAHPPPRDRDAHGAGGRGGAAPRLRQGRPRDVRGGAGTVPGLPARRRRLLGAGVPQGLNRRRPRESLSRARGRP